MIQYIAKYSAKDPIGNTIMTFSAFLNTNNNTVQIFNQDMTPFLIFCNFPHQSKKNFDNLIDFHEYVDEIVLMHKATILTRG